MPLEFIGMIGVRPEGADGAAVHVIGGEIDRAWVREFSQAHERAGFDKVLVGYTTADAFVFIDIPKYVFTSVDQTRVMFRVRNLTDRIYAVWSDPSYPDQILLGAPRSYEVAAAFKF